MSKEQVNHPSHYGGENNPYETIKVIEDWGLHRDFYVANAVKYISRAGKKGDIIEDLNKAINYLNFRAEIQYDYPHCSPKMELVDVLKNWSLSENLESAINHIYVVFVVCGGFKDKEHISIAIQMMVEILKKEINRLENERS